MEYEFTSESVSIGHPDKVADLISDSVATFLLSKNISHRAAIETLVTTNMVTIAGEYKSNNFDKDEIEKIIRNVVSKIGYEQDGFHHERLNIYNELHGQSPDIALGTDNFGAGDQGLMFGYACLETENYMPMAIYLCHKILERVQYERKNHAWILPDNKSQVTLTYNDINKPKNIEKIVCSTQHAEDVDIEYVRKKIEEIIRDEIKEDLSSTEFLINPTGRFVIGGPDGDTGLTGRKIIVDTYGGAAPHGGGAFSGKDPSKVDRSAAYAARHLAKNIVAHELAEECLVRVSYAIGKAEPYELTIETFDTLKVDEKKLNDFVRAFDMKPGAIIERLNLTSVNYKTDTLFSHFGHSNRNWEKIENI